MAMNQRIESPLQRSIIRRLLRFWPHVAVTVVTFASVYLVWVAPHVVRARIQRPIIASIEAAGGSAYFDYQVADGPVKPHTPPPGAFVTRALFGDDIYATVHVVVFLEPNVKDEDVANLHKLSELKDVYLTGDRITDACIGDLIRIRGLRGLNLSNTAISPRGLSQLSSLPGLHRLTLFGESVTDEHVATLPQFSNLEKLQVIRAPVTDDVVARHQQIGRSERARFTIRSTTTASLRALGYCNYHLGRSLRRPEAMMNIHGLQSTRDTMRVTSAASTAVDSWRARSLRAGG